MRIDRAHREILRNEAVERGDERARAQVRADDEGRQDGDAEAGERQASAARRRCWR